MSQETSLDVAGRPTSSRPSLARPCKVTLEDEREFQRAMESYKRASGRQFPTWSEILEVLHGLGYAKRVWRPVEPPPAAAPSFPMPDPHFRALGEDSATGVLGWYSWVETSAST